MILDFSALYAHVFFKLAFCRFKCITQGYIDIFMGLLVVVVTTDHDLFVGNVQINPDLVEITLMLVMVFGLYGHPATDNVITEVFELCCFFTYPGLDCVGVRDTAKCNL